MHHILIHPEAAGMNRKMQGGVRQLSEEQRKDLILFLLSQRGIKPRRDQGDGEADAGHSLMATALSILDCKFEKKGVDIGYQFDRFYFYPTDEKFKQDVFELYHNELIKNDDGDQKAQLLPLREIELTAAGKTHINFFQVESRLAKAFAKSGIDLNEVATEWQNLLSMPMSELLATEITARAREDDLQAFNELVAPLSQ